MINTTSKQTVITPIPQEQKVNENNNTNYPISSNAVKLLPYISNNNGKIKLYTEINSNLKIGDKVFIMYNSNNHNRNVELFKQSKLSESLGAVFFYSKYLKTYTKAIQDCLAEQVKVIEEAKQMMMDDLEFQTFLNDGDGNTVLA